MLQMKFIESDEYYLLLLPPFSSRFRDDYFTTLYSPQRIFLIISDTRLSYLYKGLFKALFHGSALYLQFK